jgi:opacity protein-like surface antigen
MTALRTLLLLGSKLGQLSVSFFRDKTRYKQFSELAGSGRELSKTAYFRPLVHPTETLKLHGIHKNGFSLVESRLSLKIDSLFQRTAPLQRQLWRPGPQSNLRESASDHRRMKIIWMSGLAFFLLVPVARPQVPVAAGYSPSVSVAVGYSYASVPVPALSRLNMNGVGSSITLDMNAHLGVEAEVNYLRTGNAFNTGHPATLFTYMAGPVVYLHRGRRFDIYGRALAGAAYETGVNFGSRGQLLTGYVNKFAWSAGGGFEYKLDSQLSLRFGANYLNTQAFNSATTTAHQNDVQAFVGVSYRFGGGRR